MATRAKAVVGDQWGVSNDATKFRILQLYANEEQHSGATPNRKEDRAHVIALLSAQQWEADPRCHYSFLFLCTDSIYIYTIFSLLPQIFVFSSKKTDLLSTRERPLATIASPCGMPREKSLLVWTQLMTGYHSATARWSN